MFKRPTISLSSIILFAKKAAKPIAGPRALGWFLVFAGLALSMSGLNKLSEAVNQKVSEESVSCPESGLIRERVVDISGAVVKPGLYKLPAGNRLGALIEQAGGFSKEADPLYIAKNLNLAQEVKDGDKIYIPFAGELEELQEAQAGAEKNSAGVSSLGSVATKISINQAESKELESLPEIGAKRAADIIANRPYASLSELVSKEVVTQRIFDNIEPLISL